MTPPTTDPRYLFVIGTGRCGSTFVQELIARHSDVGWISNLDSALAPLDPKGRANRAIANAISGSLGRRDRAYLKHRRYTLGERIHFGPSEAYKLLDAQLSPVVSKTFRDLTEDDVTPWLAKRFRAFFAERAAAQGTPVFMHKFTGWPRARFIHAIMPEARFLHVVRDGRAVASSIVQRPWWKGRLGVPGWGFGELSPDLADLWVRHDRSLITLAGLEWRILMDAFDTAREQVGEDLWLEIRYEDLVADPRAHWRAILDLAGLIWDERFEAAFRAYPVATGRREAFRSDLTPRQVERLEEAIGAHLEARGYRTGLRRRGSPRSRGGNVAVVHGSGAGVDHIGSGGSGSRA
jgi:hypothetical protein